MTSLRTLVVLTWLLLTSAGAICAVTLDEKAMLGMGLTEGALTHVRLSGNGARLFLIQHGFGDICRVIVVDSASGQKVASIDLKVGLVADIAPNAAGTHALVAADHGQSAWWVDVAAGTAERIFMLDPAGGFRFMPPIQLQARADGTWITRGYFVGGGKTEGEYLVSLKPGGTLGISLGIEKKLDVLQLGKASQLPGMVVNVAPEPSWRRTAFTVQNSKDAATLLLKSDEAVKSLDQGRQIRSLVTTAQELFYVVERKPGEAALMRADDKGTGVVATGYYSPPVFNASADTMLIGKVETKPLQQTLHVARRESGWKLQPVTLPAGSGEPVLYGLSDDGKTYMVWTKDRIVVAPLP